MPLCEIARVLQLPDESCTFWTRLYLLAVIAQKLTRSYWMFLILMVELKVVCVGSFVLEVAEERQQYASRKEIGKIPDAVKINVW
jgi:hypothetical protein